MFREPEVAEGDVLTSLLSIDVDSIEAGEEARPY